LIYLQFRYFEILRQDTKKSAEWGKHWGKHYTHFATFYYLDMHIKSSVKY